MTAIVKSTRLALMLSIPLLTGLNQTVSGADVMEEIVIVGTTPGPGAGQDAAKIPFAVRSAHSGNLAAHQSLDLTDFMNQSLASVNINSAQNNPMQPDLQFRGFTASPLLGLPQGIAVYQNGVRVNEPLGDAVNWDLLPESAVDNLVLISGADPLFGLNALGGALAINMKNGFTFNGQQAEVQAGSWDRVVATLESGGNNGAWGYYANISYFDESGWRDLSDSDSLNIYGSLGWRDGDISMVNLNYQKGASDLTGNGAAPVGLLAIDRVAIFTGPDITENSMDMLSMDGSHFITPDIQLAGTAFWRGNETDSINGDASEFGLCEYSGGARSLFAEIEEIEESLEDELGIALDDICAGRDPAIASFADLEDYIETQALLNGLDPEDFEIEDITDELSGTGTLSDAAINNISRREQESWGVDGKVLLFDRMFDRENRLTAGFSYFHGEAEFHSELELSGIDPVTRSTQGLGTGIFVDSAATSVHTETDTWSLYFTDTITISERLAITLGGRYNDTRISLRDASGDRPELNGDHDFSRFNPTVGFTWSAHPGMNFYGSYSESNRTPTPIELSCNEGVFELARQAAMDAGGDPDDVEFECRLPNAFLADPPLADVVTKSIELGVRGRFEGINYLVGVFHAINSDDIIFQTTGRATGLFANVDETRRMGIDLELNGSIDRLDWFMAYSHIEATFRDDFDVLSPNHPLADDAGVIAVRSGDRIPGIPENLFKAGGVYHFNDRFEIGLDLVYNSDQVIRGDEINALDTVDGYALLNLRASYILGDRVTAFARVTNLLDKDYENFGLLGEDPSEVLDNLTDNRPIYLGAGSPRAGWVGLRVRF
ncbi:MAG TPA: TonB-dependent receptor [Gammaproteobacteria bacterium]|nr:TonB-dependent receptor [Gammaproteobacteria bacterium]